jgi:hypothetical protein
MISIHQKDLAMKYIEVELFEFRGFTFERGDIAFGNTLRGDRIFNVHGKLSKFRTIWPNVTFHLRGVTNRELDIFEAERVANIQALLNRTLSGETIEVAGDLVENAWLKEVTPSSKIQIGGSELIESLQLKLVSLNYDASTTIEKYLPLLGRRA